MKYEILKLQERIEIGIEAGESHFREFKSAFDRDSDGKTSPRDFKAICRDIADALVAFANADGGEVYLGVEDDGTVSGIPHKPDLISGMKDSYGKYIHQDTPIPGSSVG
ncbi:MAG: Divergent AAA domain protein [Syntrophus sp. PtaB.Bin138]|jgi:ATP-dependent DNA helicase RecG|nr:MAG: Divergent AAA domain protein [Syntrophus sp. PtaB.Bin138]